MHFSLSWLQEFFNTPLSAKNLEQQLTLIGLEVDAIEVLKPSFSGLIVAKVLEVSPHPDADRLCIAKVFTGQEELQVVCGAKNCTSGLLTAFAPVGSKISDSNGKVHTLKKGKLRGVDSFGMLVSAQEMGLEDSSEGLIEFSSELKPGEELSPFFEDEVIEISFTPNLGHAMSVFGIARELAPIIGEVPALKARALKENKSAPIEKKVSLSLLDKERCLQYTCRLIEGVKIAPSPFWLQQKLKASGIKSINNVVDVTNYILMEMGHPLHAFDFDSIKGDKIEVNSFSKETTFTTLDGTEHKVPPDSLFITDSKKPLAIAGVMGGENSQVEDKSVNILLEAAVFDPSSIRKTSKALGLYTDASKHFERGVDPFAPTQALDRAASMIQELAEGEVAQGILSESTFSFEPTIITCRANFINKLLGTKISSSKMIDIFKMLDFQPQLIGKNEIEITVPSYRNDVKKEIDLVEEIARFYGFDKIAQSRPSSIITELPDCALYSFEKKVHQLLLQEGLQEILTCDLISPKMAELDQKPNESISALNYVSIDQSILRNSLLANHLEVLKRNQSHQHTDLQVFEIGKIYSKKGDCFSEETRVGITFMGDQNPYHFQKENQKLDFFHLKGTLENLLNSLEINQCRFEKSQYSFFHPGIQAKLFYKDKVLGYLGEIHPSILRAQDLKQSVFMAELSLPSMMALSSPLQDITPLSPYPSSERDWTLTCLEDMEVGHLLHFIRSLDSRLLKEVYLLDLYRSETIGTHRKNVTLRFVYRNDKKTISFEATEIEHAKITSEVLEKMKNLIIQPI